MHDPHTVHTLGQPGGLQIDVSPFGARWLSCRVPLRDGTLREAGFAWYEVSNFARTPEHRSRHNLAYWKGGDWWGIGPGAHRHRDGLRSWNVKHPSRYARMLASGELPVADSEQVAAEDRLVERIMLELRIADGLAVDVVPEQNRSMLEVHRNRGHLDPDALAAGRAVLTREGRLLADAVIRDLVP